MATSDDRLHEIDNLVDESGHRYNPNTGRFEATIGSDAENYLDHDSQSFRDTVPDVTDEEWKDYRAWKRKLAEDEFGSDEPDDPDFDEDE